MSETNTKNFLRQRHLPFVKHMLDKVKDTQFEGKWKKLYEVITSDETLSLKQIKDIDYTIKVVREKVSGAKIPQLPHQNSKINHETRKIILKNSTTSSQHESMDISSGLWDNYKSKESDTDNNKSIIPTITCSEKKYNSNIDYLKEKYKIKDCFVPLKRCVLQNKMREVKLPTPHTNQASSFSFNSQVTIKSEPELDIPYEEPKEFNATPVVEEFETEMETPKFNEIVEYQQKKPRPSETNVVHKRTVIHMHYTVIDSVLSYCCNLCVLQTKEFCFFEKHLYSQHKNYRWFGKCRACQKNIKENASSLMDELNHMVVDHILCEDFIITNLPVGMKRADSYMASFSSIRIAPQKEEKKQFHNCMNAILTADMTMRKLRPWMHSMNLTNRKVHRACITMLENFQLNALFKCMATKCLFCTSSSDLFREHLEIHNNLHPTDSDSFSLCAYCEYQSESAMELIEHIMDEHQKSPMQCCFCFYRSFDLQMRLHQSMYHPTKNPSVILIHNPKLSLRHSDDELIEVKFNSSIFAPAMSCFLCAFKCFNIHNYKKHIERCHTRNVPSRDCTKCSQSVMSSTTIRHLRKCFNYGEKQCGWCRYGAPTTGAIKSHIANHHPSKTAYFYDRMVPLSSPGIKFVGTLEEFSLNMCGGKLLIVLSLVTVVLTSNRRNNLRITPAQGMFEPDFCELFPDIAFFAHENCNQFWGCDEFNEPYEDFCPDDQPIFDAQGQFCGVEGEAVCWSDVDDNPDYPDYPDNGDSECPLNTNEVIFLPGDHCDEYYICLNGVPNLVLCRDGQHWNIEMEYCDDPSRAGCDETAIDDSPTLPDCRISFVGTLPHPTNCNWFVYCDNGNRSIQQCQHLFHYDVEQERCVFINNARCIKDVQ
ncbi:CLUMA_CG003452, isoform A [Clunio marinus]|uniref:CLUMA_CG003452, isoform A n=1 Tax=Clunio marinus TaxID=568069 RepID=A0A1J1HQU6_9DIPT|nr:CLUMA_CG003452, isoform A [Clunio marinus]